MDFFLPDLSTHPIPVENETCAMTATRKIAEGSRFAFSVGCSDFATYDEEGDETDELVFPFEVILSAT